MPLPSRAGTIHQRGFFFTSREDTMPDPTPDPTPDSTPHLTFGAQQSALDLALLFKLIEEIPALVTDVTALVSALKAGDLSGAVGKLQQAINDLKIALS